MNESLRWTFVLVGLTVIIILLSANLFLLWNIYKNQPSLDLILSRVEKLEASQDMTMAIALSNQKQINEDQDQNSD